MKKDLNRAVLATIIGALAVMTGCDNTRNQMHTPSMNSKKEMKGKSDRNGSDENRMDQRSAKPKPNNMGSKHCFDCDCGC